MILRCCVQQKCKIKTSLRAGLLTLFVMGICLLRHKITVEKFDQFSLAKEGKVIPRRSRCKTLFTIAEGFDDVIRDMDAEYMKLSLVLPSLLEEQSASVGKQRQYRMLPDTRLHLGEGHISYIPCKITEYDANNFSKCCKSRWKLGARTWIAFVGDSNVRLKTLEFLSFLPKDFRYKYFLGDMEVTKEDLYLALAYTRHRPPTFDVFGFLPLANNNEKATNSSYSNRKPSETDEGVAPDEELYNGSNPIKLKNTSENVVDRDKVSSTSSSSFSTQNPYYSDYLALTDTRTAELNASRKDFIDYQYSPKPLRENDVPFHSYQLRLTLVWAPAGWKNISTVREWADGDAYPDVITISFGMWLLLLREVENLDDLTPFTEADVRARDLLEITSKLASKTHVLLWELSRYRWFIFEDERKTPKFKYPKSYMQNIVQLSRFSHGTSLLSSWLWSLLRRTGAWHWDTALPFHMANVRECERLSEADDYNHTFYRGLWWACKDLFHPSFETSNNEIQMLLNFLCNKYVANDPESCCSATDNI